PTMVLSPCGLVVRDCLLEIPKHFPQILLDEFIIMPNHIHMIIMVGARHAVPLQQKTESFGKPVKGSLPTIIRSFKSATTNAINDFRQSRKYTLWQRGYFEHIIRDDDKLNKIRLYIANNHIKWTLDKENPINKKACKTREI
ncbi:MAG: transposase, partial [Deltaproteobacteria bacterium]